jgi:hypothetical protein
MRSHIAPLRGIHLADATGDGMLDAIAVGATGLADFRFYVIAVLPGDGHGHHGTAVHTATGIREDHNGMRSAVADFTGDGRPDVAILRTSSIHLYAGRTDGTFQAPAVSQAGVPYYGTAEAAELTGDGKPDLIVLGNGRTEVYVNEGGGRFRQIADTYSGTFSRNGYALADFDADGKLDAVYGPHDAYLGLGNGTFDWVFSIGRYVGYGSVVGSGDFDEDGFPDLIIQNETVVYFHHGNGDGTFAQGRPIDFDLHLGISSHGAVQTVIADVDGDQHLDLVNIDSAQNRSARRTEVLLGNGNGGFRAAETIRYGGFPDSIALADLDDNGWLDVVAIESESMTVDVVLTGLTESQDRPVELTVTSPAVPLTHGEHVPIAVAVRDAASGEPAAGVVLVHEGARTVAVAHLDAAGHAVLAPVLPAGAHDLVTTFARNAVFASATAAAIHQDVAKAPTSVRLIATQTVGAGFEYDAALIIEREVRDGAFATGTFTAKVTGFAPRTELVSAYSTTYGFVATAVGAYTIEVEYSGDANYEGSRASTTVTVTPVPAVIALVVRPRGHVPVGAPVTLTALVNPANATGTVTFYDRDLGLITAPVKDGIATATITSLLGGRHLLHAEYSGDGVVADRRRSMGVYVTVDGPPAPKRRSGGTR